MQMGRTKVFLRRKAFEALEHLRSTRLVGAATKIQSGVRMFIAKVDYDIAIYAILVMQSFVRRVGAYRAARKMRIEMSILSIQCAWRCYRARRVLSSARWIASWCQSTYRGAIARQYCAYLFLDRKAYTIQRAWKRHKGRRTFYRLRKAVVFLQTRMRMRIAKRELLRLRKEARDLCAVAAERDQFRRELMGLRKELEEVKKSPPVIKVVKSEEPEKSAELRKLREEVGRLRAELEEAYNMSTVSSQGEEVQFLVEELARREEHLDLLKREVATLRSKEDSFSVKSFTIDASPTSHARSTGLSRLQTSPSRSVRSDVSLLDVDEYDDPNVGVLGASMNVSPAGKKLPITPRLWAKPDPPRPEDAFEELQVAIRQGNREAFDRILRTSSETCLLINQGDRYGRTCLHLCALALRSDMAEALISKGAVVNAQDNDGETPLHLADNHSVTEVLLKKGRANPNIPNVDGICAIHLAVQRRDVDSVRALLRNGKQRSLVCSTGHSFSPALSIH